MHGPEFSVRFTFDTGRVAHDALWEEFVRYAEGERDLLFGGGSSPEGWFDGYLCGRDHETTDADREAVQDWLARHPFIRSAQVGLLGRVPGEQSVIREVVEWRALGWALLGGLLSLVLAVLIIHARAAAGGGGGWDFLREIVCVGVTLVPVGVVGGFFVGRKLARRRL